MSGFVRWGASPLSSAVNWLGKEVFGTRQKAIAAAPSGIPVVTITLGSLTFSSTAFTVGTPSGGAILGATSGSTIANISSLPTGLTISGSARTWAWDGTGIVSSGSFQLSETLAGAVVSPVVSTIAFTINAAPSPTAGQLNFSVVADSGLLALLEDI